MANPKHNGEFKPGVKPEIKPPNPKEHPFVPYLPGSTSCRWCAFSMQAHLEVADGVDLSVKNKAQIAESG